MWKIVVLCLCVFAMIFCIIGFSLNLPSPSNSNPNPSPRESENVEDFQFEEKMEQLENFHSEFKDFKSSLVELSAAVRRFHQSVAAANGSSTKQEPEPEKPDSRSITSCSVAMETLSSLLSNKQTIYPHGNSTSLEVLCDFETDGGGWTLIQKRTTGPAQEFNRTWNDYANGFGLRAGNFWLGLDNIHALTKKGDQELRIELEDFQGEKRWAKYSSFSVSDASDFYRLSISDYSGDAGNDMNSSTPDWVHDGMRFSTWDKDNDKNSGNCAVSWSSGWWFNACFAANLNGVYREKGETVPSWEGIIWNSWKLSYYLTPYSLAKTEMKIRKRR